jgi:hypothetical protein
MLVRQRNVTPQLPQPFRLTLGISGAHWRLMMRSPLDVHLLHAVVRPPLAIKHLFAIR